MTDEVTKDLLAYVQDRTGLSTTDSIAAIAAVREWLELRLGNRSRDAGRDRISETHLPTPRAS